VGSVYNASALNHLLSIAIGSCFPQRGCSHALVRIGGPIGYPGLGAERPASSSSELKSDSAFRQKGSHLRKRVLCTEHRLKSLSTVTNEHGSFRRQLRGAIMALTTGFGDYVGGGSRRGAQACRKAARTSHRRGQCQEFRKPDRFWSEKRGARKAISIGRSPPATNVGDLPMDRALFSNAEAYPKLRPWTIATEKQKTMESKQCRSAG